LIGTSTNQAYPPRVRDLRVIAFAWYEKTSKSRRSCKFNSW
jgi:hypothetical protein